MKACLTLALSLIAALSFAKGIAVVDMELVLDKHPNTASDKKVLDSTLEDYSKERDTLRDALDAKQADLEKRIKEAQNPMLAPAKAEELRKSCETAYRQLERDRMNAENQMAERARQLTEMENRFIKRTSEEIISHIEAYAKKKDIDIVLYKNVVPYLKADYDITNQIIILCGGKPDAKPETTEAEAPKPTVKKASELKAPEPVNYKNYKKLK